MSDKWRRALCCSLSEFAADGAVVFVLVVVVLACGGEFPKLWSGPFWVCAGWFMAGRVTMRIDDALRRHFRPLRD